MTTQSAESEDFEQRATGDRALAFTPGRLAVLVPYAFVLWASAWSLIHFRGPRGAFDGNWGILAYLGTIPATIVINWLHLKLARLPKHEIVNAVAITLTIATTLDGTCFWFFPGVYASDPVVQRHGAAFIIWAGAVAFWLAFITRLTADRSRSDKGAGA
jgi:hypothetical protein